MNIKYSIMAISASVLLISGCAMSQSSHDGDMGKSMDKGMEKSMDQGMDKDMDSKMDKGMSKSSKMMAPFGGPADLAYANDLWSKMQKMGYNTTDSKLYVGAPPHGIVREVLEGKIDGNLVVVKRNYRGEGLTPNDVEKNRAKYIASVTVMAKKPGYDPEDKDWFWVKYKPNGEVMANPKGMKLAGKVAKGMPMGCISCHSAAPGGDFLFIQDKDISPKATLIGSL